MLHSSNCESFQQGSSIPLSQPRISLNPVIPTVISDIPCILSIPNLAPILLFIPEYRPSIKANPASRKIYWGPSKRSRKSRLLSLASRIPYPVSRAYFQYQVSPLYCFKIPKPGLQMGRIPDPEKPFDDPQLFPLDFRILLCNESQIKWFLFLVFLSRNTINRTPLTANTKNGLGITRPRSTITGKYLCHFYQTTRLVYTKSSSIRLFK